VTATASPSDAFTNQIDGYFVHRRAGAGGRPRATSISRRSFDVKENGRLAAGVRPGDPMGKRYRASSLIAYLRGCQELELVVDDD
jgi:hypothetical protein